MRKTLPGFRMAASCSGFRSSLFHMNMIRTPRYIVDAIIWERGKHLVSDADEVDVSISEGQQLGLKSSNTADA
jgi:hypothetical protein